MTLHDLLDMGITARLDADGGLLIDTPKGVLTDALIERIRQSKPCLIAELHTAAPATHWLLHFVDSDPMEVWFAPAVTHAEVLAQYSGAVAAEPVTERTGIRPATPHERDELLALIAAIFAEDTDDDRQEAIDAALRDPDGALTCYRAIAAERGITVVALPTVTTAASTPTTTCCKTCLHRKRPGRTDPGYCAGWRDDLPLAYGGNHPLRRLPDDLGEICTSYTPARKG